MSITVITQATAEKSYAICKQGTWGTAIADDAAFGGVTGCQLDCEPFEINLDVKSIDIPQSVGSRKRRDASFMTHYKRSAPTASITMYPTIDNIDLFLAAHFQSVTEGGTTPYAKTFVFGDTQPVFTSNAGYFYTLIEHDPAASKSIKAADMISNKIVLSIEEGQPLKMVLDLIGRGLPILTSNPSGTWTRTSEAGLIWHNDIDRCTIDYGTSADFHLKSLEITSSWETVELIGQSGVASFTTFGLAGLKHEFKMTVLKDADFHEMLTSLTTNEAITCRVGWGNATAGTVDNDFDIAWRGKLTSAVKNHDEIMTAELSGIMLEDDTGAVEPIKIIVANAIERNW